MGILPRRSSAMIDRLLDQEEKVKAMIDNSFLNEAAKAKYLNHYVDKRKRFRINDVTIKKSYSTLFFLQQIRRRDVGEDDTTLLFIQRFHTF